MKMVPLGEVIKPSGRRAGVDTSLPVYSVTKHRGFVPSEDYFKKQVFGKDLSTYKKVSAGDFAYATIHLDEGSIGIAPTECLISPMYTVFTVDHNHVVPEFLIKFMKSPLALAKYEGLGNGSVHRRRSISLKALGSIRVPLPPLDEQRRIAAILDKADAIRRKRRQAIAHLDSLTQSTYEDTSRGISVDTQFGDLVEDFRNGVSPSTSGSVDAKVLTLSAITQGAFDNSQAKLAKFDKPPGPEKRVSHLDLLICRGNGNKYLVGVGQSSPEDLPEITFPDTVIAARVNPTLVLMEYLKAAWSSQRTREQIESKARTTNGTYKINQKSLAEIRIGIPPLSEQRRFQLQARTISAARSSILLGMSTDEALFASLQSRAFRGEL